MTTYKQKVQTEIPSTRAVKDKRGRWHIEDGAGQCYMQEPGFRAEFLAWRDLYIRICKDKGVTA